MVKTKSKKRSGKSRVNWAKVPNRDVAVVFALVIGVIGAYLLVSSRAATPTFNIQPENATLSGGATKLTESGTSGGQALGFAAGQQPPTGTTVTIAAAGDIGTSGSMDSTVANLIKNDSSIQAVLALGDIAYQNATNEELKYYNDTWGAFKAKTYPAIGNHEYYVSAQPYTDYWNSAGQWTATPKPPSPVQISLNKQWYSFTLGNWQLFALDSEKNIPAQTTFVQQEMATNPKACSIIFWHSPYWAGSSPVGSGAGVSMGRLKPIMEAFQAAKGDITLAGHEHAYVSFPKLSVSNNQASSTGIRSWVSGMGGTGPTSSGLKNSYSGVVYLDSSNNTGANGSGGAKGGYLKMELKPTSYTWQYIDSTGTVRHSGSDNCVN